MSRDVVDAVLAAAGRHPGRTAVIDGRELTYRDLAAGVRAVAAAMGPLHGEAVLFVVRPGPDAVVAALGAVAAGGMLVLADPGLTPAAADARLALAPPAWVVADSVAYAFAGPLRGLARRRGLWLPDLREPIPGRPVRHMTAGRWLPGVPRGAARLRHLPPADGVPSGGDAGQPAVVAFTSGTTGRPRGVVHTRGSLGEGATLFQRAVPLTPGDVVHTDQLMLGLPALMAGATWSLPGSRPFTEELATRGATHAFCVPARLGPALDAGPEPPATLRCLLLGTAPAPAGVLRRARAAAPHAEVLSVYATTEALPIAIASAEEKLEVTEGDLLGAPLPGVHARIAADGELFVSGPHLAAAYLGGPPLTEVATGDLARLDDHGRLVLLGRKKDMIIRDGVNIYPGLYEPAVAALPGVAEAALLGLPDPETGDEEVVLAVVPEDGFSLTALRRSLPEVVDAAAMPGRVAVLDGFPRAGRSAKLDRDRLRDLVAR
ncbi:class I adenylate-forming enzyme family protein [Sphaerisporangium rubeum]|uniref:Acyl-CoA synthetase (AMP-forming)/AMP-acid ligase II n=1 Tax=Sphaerisporangium rubeum TaxID=321317 RepID=A0A7X0IA54_9ACTN|nr:class I adenylate-forming enzyme family protein [Sphaerisporangium rubeum]MBB6470694.1 acyl-CoA synthetase (AMP-forming)/AMP-acid ligase II [Sphaerisporangium rubeum]